MKTILLLAALLLAASANATTVYKTIGKDGKVVYTDTPPAEPKSATTLNIADQATSPLPASVLKYQEQLAKSADKRIREQPVRASGTPVLFVASWCGYCRKAKEYLQKNQIAYQEYDIDTEAGMRAFASAGGRGGIPLLVVDGRSTRGFSEASYAKIFAKTK